MHGYTYLLILTVKNVSLTYFAQFYLLNVKSNFFSPFQENIIPPNASPNTLCQQIRDLRCTILNQNQIVNRQSTHMNDLLKDTHDPVHAYRLLNARCEKLENKLGIYTKLFCKSFLLRIVLMK
jgi:hypothetical protein